MGNSGKAEPLVSVIIPTRNSEGTIERCLLSLHGQSHKNLEIIVVDNYSTDGTREIAKKYGVEVCLKGPERGAQINFGAEKARGKYLYRIDADFVLQSNVIEEAVEKCERLGYDAIIIHNTSDPSVSFWARIRKAERDYYRNGELNVAARFWSKEAFEAIQGFDENLVAGDDYDLHNRLVAKGFKIGRIEAGEIHIGEPKTLAEVARKHIYYGRTIKRFIKKDLRKSIQQLSPLRRSYIKSVRILLDKPSSIVGFALYQTVRYMATVIGFMTA